jgi:hypothetical protein
MFEKGDLPFTYDLRSAYHHLEIFEDHKTYLGFSWYYKRGNNLLLLIANNRKLFSIYLLETRYDSPDLNFLYLYQKT